MAGLADRRIDEALAVLASRDGPAAAGVATALACATAAALVELTAGLAAGRLADGAAPEPELVQRMRSLGAMACQLRVRLPAVADADAAAYARVLDAADPKARTDALALAAEPPLDVAEAAAELAEAAAEIAAAGDWPFRPDALAAGRLAAASAAAGATLVDANVGDDADPLAERARAAAERARRATG